MRSSKTSRNLCSFCREINNSIYYYRKNEIICKFTMTQVEIGVIIFIHLLDISHDTVVVLRAMLQERISPFPIPREVTGIFQLAKSFQPHNGLRVDSTSKENE
jgi:hypothetical protein